MGMLKVCRHRDVLIIEFLVDLMDDELGVAEYLYLFSAHLLSQPEAS